MLVGHPPYHEYAGTPAVWQEHIMRGATQVKWPAMDALARDLILRLMDVDPSRRYGNMRDGAADVFAHPWFSVVDWQKLSDREIAAPYLPIRKNDGDASACVCSHPLQFFPSFMGLAQVRHVCRR